MPVRKPHTFQPGIYFITFTCHRWLPLFAITQAYGAVYNWFDWLKKNGHQVVGYVIMPNHIHVLIHFTDSEKSINTVVSNGKRFMAYEMVQQLKLQGREDILKILSGAVSAQDKKKGQKHLVFESSFDLKPCFHYTFIEQKLDYIHANPVRGKWMLSDQPYDYVHSSAKFYESGQHGIYEVIHYLQLLNENLVHPSAFEP